MVPLDLHKFVVAGILWSSYHARANAQSNQGSLLFHHRAYHAAAVIGDYLYIDGGEITTWNGTGDGYQEDTFYYGDGNITTLTENYTLAFDLTTSWTNSTVELHQIGKNGAPVLNSEALWPDALGQTLYSYNGGISSAYPSEIPSTPFNQLWQFTPSAGGISGQWVQVFPSTASTFETLQRTVDAAYGFGGAVGYAVGGYSGSYAVPGMVEFNTSSQEWSNSSILAISKSNSATSGMAQWVPTFGPEGLLFLLGGEAANSPFTLTIMWMYDPSTKTWRSQTTTGDVPSVMDKGCVVGAEGDDGTYEIFLYGQANYWYAATDSSIADSVVYVLSLPSFHWTKQDAVATVARNRHTCNVIGGRQMVIVGGVVGIVGQLFTADPWDNGIGIFDMSAFEWTDSYNPNALPYVTPQVVKDYAKTHPHPSAWADSTVEAWFTKATQTPSPPNGSSNTGAIAGGVVGGVAALAILAGVIFFVRRKRRRTRPPERPIELESKGEASELEARLNAQPKAVDDEGVKELDSDDRYELEGGWHGNESGVK